MKITDDHWLDIAKRELLPGGSVMPTRRFLVIHFTGGWTAQGSVDFWRTAAAKGACAHLIIDRDGSIIQCRPFNRTAGHAGVSAWKDPKTGIKYTGLNACSIGIELANSGDLGRTVYPNTMGDLSGKPIPVITARHKNGGPSTTWEKYPDAQMAALKLVSGLLLNHYNLDDLIGHDDIAPDRKNDPGPAFPMASLREHCGFSSTIPKLK